MSGDTYKKKPGQGAAARLKKSLQERIKELNCIYGISNLVEDDNASLADLLQATVELIPPAWQYPEITCAIVNLNGEEYRTTPSKCHQAVARQSGNIVVHGRVAGTVDVCYFEERPQADEGPFLQEERRLLDAIAERLGRVAERKEAGKALQESEEKHRRLFESSRDAIMTLAPPSWRFSSGNPAAAELFGVQDEKDFISRPPWEYSPQSQPDGRPSADKAKEMIGKAMQEGSHFFEWQHMTADGKEFPATVLLTRLELNGQALLQATVRDITDLRRMEEQLRHAEKMQAIGELAGGVAHDFNNKLAAILGYSELMEMRIEGENEDLRSLAEGIRKAAASSALLTAQLLAFARKGQYQLIAMNLHEVIEEMASLLQHTLDKRIRIVRQLEASSPIVMGDPGQLENALLNIALNARDSMPDGGELKISTTITSLSQEECQGYVDEIKPGNFLEVAVADTGKGMSKELRQRIFEPFFTTKNVGQGTGMGLSSAYGTVRNHGGSIKVNSQPGVGSTFTVYLPLAKASSETAPAVDKPVLLRGQARILVVDDEKLICDMTMKMLHGLGYTVTTCTSGKEALQLYRNDWKEIDLVLLDMVMPEMGGRETLTAMRKINLDIKVLLCSGYSLTGETQEIVKKGTASFIQKPFRMEKLSQKIAKALQM
jgi:PAS domain S-box-containing protein